MNPRHRDRVAFLRICSGRLAKDMAVDQRAARDDAAAVARLPLLRPRPRDGAGGLSGRRRRPRQPGPARHRRHAVRGQARAVPAHSAVPAGALRDRRPDRHAAQAVRRGRAPARGGGADAGVHAAASGARHPIVGVVGALQFDVIEARLSSEYGIRCRLEPLPHVAARWPVPIHADTPPLRLPTSGVMAVRDRRDRPVLLFQSDWHLRYTSRRKPRDPLQRAAMRAVWPPRAQDRAARQRPFWATGVGFSGYRRRAPSEACRPDRARSPKLEAGGPVSPACLHAHSS